MTTAASRPAERLTPGVARFVLAVAYLCLASLYAWQASKRVSPTIFSDEIEFTQISRGIAENGVPSGRGEPSGFGSLCHIQIRIAANASIPDNNASVIALAVSSMKKAAVNAAAMIGVHP